MSGNYVAISLTWNDQDAHDNIENIDFGGGQIHDFHGDTILYTKRNRTNNRLPPPHPPLRTTMPFFTNTPAAIALANTRIEQQQQHPKHPPNQQQQHPKHPPNHKNKARKRKATNKNDKIPKPRKSRKTTTKHKPSDDDDDDDDATNANDDDATNANDDDDNDDDANDDDDNDDAANDVANTSQFHDMQQRTDVMNLKAGELQAQNTAKGTTNLYGDVLTLPQDAKGYIGEFGGWCQTGPNTVFKGLQTSPDKIIYPPIAAPTTVQEFLLTHFLERPLYDKSKRNFTIKQPMGKHALANCIKALRHLYKYQRNTWPREGDLDGPTAFTIKFSNWAKDSTIIASIKKHHVRKTATLREQYHQSRGAGTLSMEGYTPAQNKQLFEFGLVDGTADACSRMSLEKRRLFHSHHTTATNTLARFDSRFRIRVCQMCSMPPPESMGPGVSDLAVNVLDRTKTNQEGQFELNVALRHHSDPLRCSWFSNHNELFSQHHIEQLEFKFEDFVPVLQEDGTYRHPWYERYAQYNIFTTFINTLTPY